MNYNTNLSNWLRAYLLDYLISMLSASLVSRPHPEGKGSGCFRHIFWDSLKFSSISQTTNQIAESTDMHEYCEILFLFFLILHTVSPPFACGMGTRLLY